MKKSTYKTTTYDVRLHGKENIMKIISFRADAARENQINDLIKVFQEHNKGIKITQSIIISIALNELWERNCLPYINEKKNFKPYKYRAEKDIPFT